MGRRGFSLTEVLAAVLIVAIGLLALIGAQIYALKTRSATTGRHTASVLATSLLNQAEDTLRQDFSATVEAARQPVPDQPGYEFAIAESTESSRLKRVAVSVYWNDKQGAQEYRLWTRLVQL